MPQRSARKRQNQISRSFTGMISPSGALSNLLTRLARTDAESTDGAFRSAVKNENQQLNHYIEEMLQENPVLAGFNDETHEVMDVSSEYRSEIQMARNDAVTDLFAMSGELTALSLMLMFLVGAATWSFSRYDVR